MALRLCGSHILCSEIGFPVIIKTYKSLFSQSKLPTQMNPNSEKSKFVDNLLELMTTSALKYGIKLHDFTDA